MRPQRHYTEEELLFQLLGEHDPELSASIAAHLERCSECGAVLYEYQGVLGRVLQWNVEEPTEDSWLNSRAQLIRSFREDGKTLARRGFLVPLRRAFGSLWEYALDNPLATMGYIAAVVAFASERTITLFRLDHLLPNTNEVLEILRQVL